VENDDGMNDRLTGPKAGYRVIVEPRIRNGKQELPADGRSEAESDGADPK